MGKRTKSAGDQILYPSLYLHAWACTLIKTDVKITWGGEQRWGGGCTLIKTDIKITWGAKLGEQRWGGGCICKRLQNSEWIFDRFVVIVAAHCRIYLSYQFLGLPIRIITSHKPTLFRKQRSKYYFNVYIYSINIIPKLSKSLILHCHHTGWITNMSNLCNSYTIKTE